MHLSSNKGLAEHAHRLGISDLALPSFPTGFRPSQHRMATALEAIVGAVFLDSGQNLSVASRAIDSLMDIRSGEPPHGYSRRTQGKSAPQKGLLWHQQRELQRSERMAKQSLLARMAERLRTVESQLQDVLRNKQETQRNLQDTTSMEQETVQREQVEPRDLQDISSTEQEAARRVQEEPRSLQYIPMIGPGDDLAPNPQVPQSQEVLPNHAEDNLEKVPQTEQETANREQGSKETPRTQKSHRIEPETDLGHVPQFEPGMSRAEIKRS